MTLESMFYISQTVAAFAIVGSLVFLGIEVRGTNRESRHRITDEYLQNLRAVELEMAGNADLARVWISGLHDFEALAPVDKARFLLVSHMVLKTNESVVLAYRDGHMTPEMYEPEDRHITEFLAYPGMQEAWDIRKHYFHRAFRTLVDEKIAAAQSSGSLPSLYREGATQVR